MRLKSDTEEEILQWYYHCEHYVAEAWKSIGFNQSSLRHSYDWVKQNGLMLDVFFISTYVHSSGANLVHCLSTEETTRNMTNSNSPEDVCSRLTLGGFGKI